MDVENQVEGSHISRKCDISQWLPCSSDGRVRRTDVRSRDHKNYSDGEIFLAMEPR